MSFFYGVRYFFNSYHIIINPVLILLTTISSAFVTYQIDEKYQEKHPIRYELYIFFIEWAPTVLITSGFLLLLVTVLNSINRKTLKQQSRELEENKQIISRVASNTKELFDGYLYHFATKKLSFTPNDRITLYIHNGDNIFIPFGRFSTNPKYAKPGRQTYCDAEGCIAKGWENDWFFDNEFTLANFKDRSKDLYNINYDVSKKLKMQSLLYAVKRIKSANGDLLGVMILESVKSNRYNENQAKKILTEQEGYIAEMISKFSDYIPKPFEAKSKGL